MLEAAGGVASSGGTWAKVVHRVLEEEHCAALIDSVNVKGNECADSSFFFLFFFCFYADHTTFRHLVQTLLPMWQCVHVHAVAGRSSSPLLV